MKYFLVLFLMCTSASGQVAEPAGGYVLGTIEMWSSWLPADEPVDLGQICASVCASYNQFNAPRGYWGKLVRPDPIYSGIRLLADGNSEKRFFCHIRVTKFTPTAEPATN